MRINWARRTTISIFKKTEKGISWKIEIDDEINEYIIN